MEEEEALRWAAELDAEERAKKDKQQVMMMMLNARHASHARTHASNVGTALRWNSSTSSCTDRGKLDCGVSDGRGGDVDNPALERSSY